jgi:hypothetical protein
MKIVIRLTRREELKALPVLLRHSTGTILPDRTYILSAGTVQALRHARVRFTTVASELVGSSAGGSTIR